MPTLTVGGYTVVVRDPDGGNMRRIPRTLLRKTFGGKIRSATGSGPTTRREWPLETSWMAKSTVEAIEAACIAAGTVAIAGDLPGASIDCTVTEVERSDGPRFDVSRLRITLLEDG